MNMVINTTRLQDQYECFMHSGKWETGAILPQHERESTEAYTRRKVGFCSPDLYTYLVKTYGILYAKNPTRTDAEDVYKLFIEDCGYGMDLNGFLEMALQLGAVLGSVAIVMDSDKEQPMTLEGMKIARTFPFMEMVLPQNITALVVDRVGRIKEFAYQYYETTDSTQSMLYEKTYKGGRVIKSHTAKNEKGDLIRVIDGDDELPLGMIPVVMVVPSREPLVTSRVPSSPTLGLYQQQLNIAVTNSLMDEALYSQQFSVLAFYTLEDLKNLKLGNMNGVKLAPTDRAEFITPSGTPIDLMLKRIDASVAMMIRTFANMLTNGTTQSGEAKVIDRQVGALQLKGVANYMETIEYKIYELFQAFMGQDVATTGYDYTVTYFKDFDLTDISSYIEQATNVLGLSITDDAKAEIRTSVLRKFLSGEDAETITRITELEAVNKEPTTIDGVDDVDDNADPIQVDPQTAGAEAVQNTALNGAQVTSLVEIIASVKNATIPKESAKAIIMSAFPAVPSANIDAMLSSIVPQKPDVVA